MKLTNADKRMSTLTTEGFIYSFRSKGGIAYSGRKMTENLANVTVRGEKWKEQEGERDCQQSV
jgi:hypothetical protein